MVTNTSRSDVVVREIFQARTRMQSAYQLFHARQQEFIRLRDILVERGEWNDFCKEHEWNPQATVGDFCAA